MPRGRPTKRAAPAVRPPSARRAAMLHPVEPDLPAPPVCRRRIAFAAAGRPEDLPPTDTASAASLVVIVTREVLKQLREDRDATLPPPSLPSPEMPAPVLPVAWRQYDTHFRTLRQTDPISFPWAQPRWDLFFRYMYAKPIQGGLVVLPPRSSTKLPAVPSPFRPASAGYTRKEVNVLPATAAINTCAPNVRPPTQPAHVAFPLPTPVNAKRLQRALQGYDPAETTFLVDGFIHGFHINYFGTPTLSALHNHRIAGPFSSPPFPNFQSSPLRVVPKKEPNAFRLIHDLSYTLGNSTNEGIPKEFSTVTYETLDHVLSLLSQFGRGALIGKTDIEDAFRSIPIHPSCYHLFGFTWDSSFFYDRCLPMGCSESCRIFERLSCALQWILHSRGNVAVSHILDDFIFMGPPDSPTCLHDLNRFLHLAHELSIPIKQEKTCLPSTVITVHGIELDTVHWQARLPADKLQKLKDAIADMRKRRSVTLLRLHRAIGLLSWASRVISPGRCFIRRLINLCIGISRPNHHIRLTADVRANLAAWHCFLSSFNGVTMFIDSTWISSDSIQLYSDAASTQGFAAVLGPRWFNGKFPEIWQDYNIAVLELYPIVAALELCGQSFANHSVLFLTDNQAVV